MNYYHHQGSNYPNNMHSHASPSTWDYHSTAIIKQEPMDEDKNDSGVASGSDFHASSPGSDNSQDNPYTSRHHHHIHQQISPNNNNMSYNSMSMPPSNGRAQIISNTDPAITHYNNNNNNNNLIMQQNNYALHHHNPLTPPASEPSPRNEITMIEHQSKDAMMGGSCNASPCASPASSRPDGDNTGNDHLRRLEMSVEKTGLYPSSSCSSSKSSEHADDDVKSEMDFDDEKLIAVPKMNSHGKLKRFRCKQCDFIAITKIDFWAHTKSHIKEERRLFCKKCPFVTEYKHHLEYHLLNHNGEKPFKCQECDYSCVNKSMLNSHLKSHSSIYQYRCNDCTYASKYCHSLKLHLRKYKHSPAMVLNVDGSPSSASIIDVYGSRRGPRVKRQSSKQFNQLPPSPESGVNNMSTIGGPMMMPQLNMASLPFPYQFMNSVPNPHLLQTIQHMIAERGALLAAAAATDKNNEDSANNNNSVDLTQSEVSSSPAPVEVDVLDLSKPSPLRKEPINNNTSANKSRRKGLAFKIDQTVINDYNDDEDDEDDDDDKTTTMFSNVEAVVDDSASKSVMVSNDQPQQTDQHQRNDNKKNSCQYCNIEFFDESLHSIHMGYHGFNNPFTCNLCGVEYNDKVSFFAHIGRQAH